MNLTSKFDLYQKVWSIMRIRDPAKSPCPTCEGKGWVNINHESFRCPAGCKTGYKYKFGSAVWKPTGQLRIDQIQIRYTAPESTAQTSTPEQDVTYLTAGNYSYSSVWKESDLFITEEEARDECDRRMLNEQVP